MIRINFLGDTGATARMAVLQVGLYLGSIVIGAVICALMYRSSATEVEQLTRETDELSRTLTQLQETTTEVRNLESKRAELNSKLAVIATLKRSKAGPVRVLDDLNSALPERSWLQEIREVGGKLRLTGLALDNQTIAAFMKDLETSDFFDGIELVETRQHEREGVKISSFTLDTSVRYAGAADPTEVDGAVAGEAG